MQHGNEVLPNSFSGFCRKLLYLSITKCTTEVSLNLQIFVTTRHVICIYFSFMLHFRYNEQLTFVRSCYAKAEKYIHITLGEADIPTHTHLPPSQPAHALHCDHVASAVLLKFTFLSTNINVISVHQGSQTSENCCKTC